MIRFLKNFTGQLILGGIITALTIFSFSIYSFTDIRILSATEADTTKIVDDIPSVLFAIQSGFLREANLLSSFHHNFISHDAFLAQLEEMEKREDGQFASIRMLQKQFLDIVFLHKDEEAFSGQFEYAIDALTATRGGIEEKVKAMVEAHVAREEAREEQAQDEIGKMEAKVGDELSSLNGAVNAVLDQRSGYIGDVTARILKNSFFFMSFLLILIVGLNAYLVLQTVFSLRAILKGIKANKTGSLSYRIKLHTDNEFGTIAKSFNEAASSIQTAQEKLQETTKRAQEQAEELAEKNDHLERFQKITVGRELKMIELKKEIETLKNEKTQS